MKNSFSRFLVLVAITFGAVPPATLAPIISNGGFEIPLMAPASATYTAGQSFGGWTVESGTVSLQSECPPFSGLQSAYLNGTIYQDLNTVVGTEYSLSYARACGEGCGCDAIPHEVDVHWGAESAWDEGVWFWEPKSYLFKATDVITRLSFSGNDVSLDDVRVVRPRLSLIIERVPFNGNLLKFPDGTYIAERYSELYRLGSNGQIERKLAFDPAHPLPGITAYNTWFHELLAPLADGGFFAVVDIDIPLLGEVKRLAQFDRDGKLIASQDRPYTPFDHTYGPVGVGIQLPNGRVLLGEVGNDFRNWAFDLWPAGAFSWFPLGSTRAFALQGSNLIAAGNFSFSQSPTQTVALLRLNPDLSLDSSFRPPLCKDVSQLAVQSDGRIIARGRLADAQGVFESETSIFRLNSDGTFDRRFFQTQSDAWQAPAFAIEPSGDIIIVNSRNTSERLSSYAKLLRYHTDGRLKEAITMECTLPYFNGFDRIEPSADGSFLAHFFEGNDGPSGLYPHHWIAFKANGQSHAFFPPRLFGDYVSVYLAITNLITNRGFYVEESTDLRFWRPISAGYLGESDSGAKFWIKGPVRMTDDPGPYFLRLVQ